VVIPIVGLVALLGIFFCLHHYDLSIKKKSPVSPDAKRSAVATAEADSRPRYEIGSGQQQLGPIRSELAGIVRFEIGAGERDRIS
jgi:hypothetical protein